jgi:glutaredoxin
MDIELFLLHECPFSTKVMRFITQNRLESQVQYRNIENEKNRDRLLELTHDEQVPCLVVDTNPILESDDIIQWLQNHLVRRLAA